MLPSTAPAIQPPLGSFATCFFFKLDGTEMAAKSLAKATNENPGCQIYNALNGTSAHERFSNKLLFCDGNWFFRIQTSDWYPRSQVHWFELSIVTSPFFSEKSSRGLGATLAGVLRYVFAWLKIPCLQLPLETHQTLHVFLHNKEIQDQNKKLVVFLLPSLKSLFASFQK